MRPVRLALLLVPLLAAGCLAPEGVLPDPGPGPDPTPPATAPPPEDPTHFLPNLTVQVTDARTHVWDTPRIRLTVTFDRPLEATTDLWTGWVEGHDHYEGRTETVPQNATHWTTTHDLTWGPGNRTFRVDAAWDLDPERPPEHFFSTEAEYTIWAPVRLILNASEKHASDQNPFHAAHRVPFAPWDDESALHILRRAALTYGFDVKTHYREDLESHFVDAINGTAFRWEFPEAAGMSRNWMILLDETVTNRAVDDVTPQAEATLEFRYVRCYATGNCDDL